ncbi:MAG: NAD(P)H-hydrate dehydratase [Candidatus Latescibacterota bacterium]|nr:NAD(P)H-hydrate dehydratase [Candidatus Latescibacterota bacterium]
MSRHLPLVTAEEIAAIDAEVIAAGTPGHLLMERAGRAVWSIAAERFKAGPHSKVVFLCGKGNNGGDGFVAAKTAKRDGLEPSVVLFSVESEVVGDPLYHLNTARDAGVCVLTFSDLGEDTLVRLLSSADIVFDALLGTGLRGKPKGPIRDGIEALRGHSAAQVAVDIPSGMEPDTGNGSAAQADLTVTFDALKRGHIFYPGRALCGELAVKDIGLDVKHGIEDRVSFTASDPVLPARSRIAHKGDVGRVTVIAGSVGLTGAACLVSKAALRAGSGLVTVGLPESLADLVAVKLTETMTRALPEVRKRRCLSLRARADIQGLFENANAIALGPGLGRHHETVALVRRLIRDLTAPSVVDADGLNAFEGELGLLRQSPQPLVLTPHPGEFFRLMGEQVSDPIRDAKKLSARTGSIVVLKGAPTVIGTPEGRSFVNSSGNSGMATGGTGDVLTGIIASLIGQGLTAEESAIIGVYWHGISGDLAVDRLTERALLAGDIIETLPQAERLINKGSSHTRYIEHVEFDRN